MCSLEICEKYGRVLAKFSIVSLESSYILVLMLIICLPITFCIFSSRPHRVIPLVEENKRQSINQSYTLKSEFNCS